MAGLHLFLSPHADDVALSCGGCVAQLVAAGERVRVLTMMMGLPTDDNFSPFARAHHARWGRPGDVVAARQLRLQEDACAMAALGAQGDYLDWPDAIYRHDGKEPRGWFYTSNATLFAPLHPAEKWLAKRLADEIAQNLAGESEPFIYAPLAVGSHVDHQLVRLAAEELDGQGYTVLFFEELPYAAVEGQLAAALAKSGADSWRGETYLLDEKSLAARIAAVGCYASQLTGLFGDTTSYPARVRAYAERIGTGAGPAERMWRR